MVGLQDGPIDSLILKRGTRRELSRNEKLRGERPITILGLVNRISGILCQISKIKQKKLIRPDFKIQSGRQEFQPYKVEVSWISGQILGASDRI